VPLVATGAPEATGAPVAAGVSEAGGQRTGSRNVPVTFWPLNSTVATLSPLAWVTNSEYGIWADDDLPKGTTRSRFQPTMRTRKMIHGAQRQ
jgi:hypothetical protein